MILRRLAACSISFSLPSGLLCCEPSVPGTGKPSRLLPGEARSTKLAADAAGPDALLLAAGRAQGIGLGISDRLSDCRDFC